MFSHAQADLNLRILRRFEGTFSLDIGLTQGRNEAGRIGWNRSISGLCLRETNVLYAFSEFKTQQRCLTGVCHSRGSTTAKTECTVSVRMSANEYIKNVL